MASMKDYMSICCSAPSEYFSVVVLRNKEKLLQRTVEISERNLALLDSFFTEFPDILSWVQSSILSLTRLFGLSVYVYLYR